MSDEKTIWQGHPSQKSNIAFYLLTFWLIIPPIVRWLKTKYTGYEVTTQRIIFRTGVFSKKTDELELYRVKDFTLVLPFWLRLVGLGNVILKTSDRSTPEIMLRAVPKAEWLREQIRTYVEQARDRKRVREVDYDQDAIV